MSTSPSSTALVVGATGATGKHVVAQLLQQNYNVRAIVRSKQRLLDSLNEILPDLSSTYGENLDITEAAVLDLSDDELADKVKDCNAVVSCLGHNMTFKGMYGHTRKLVTDSAKRLCRAIEVNSQDHATKFILMGSDGVANPAGGDDKRSFSERLVLGMIRFLIPFHRDNEAAAAFISKDLGKSCKSIEWAVVRPTDLIDGSVSKYTLYEKSQGSLFGAGQATRANVAKCMVDMILQKEHWEEWKFKMPVLHDDVEVKK